MTLLRAIVLFALCSYALSQSDPTATTSGEDDDMAVTAPSVYNSAGGAGGAGNYVQENDNEHTQRFAGNGKVTVIDNKNTLDQAEEANPESAGESRSEQRKKNIQEQQQKADNEMKSKQQTFDWQYRAREFEAKQAIKKEAASKERATKETQRMLQEREAKWTSSEQQTKQNNARLPLPSETDVIALTPTSPKVKSTSEPGPNLNGMKLGDNYVNLALSQPTENWSVANDTLSNNFCFLKGLVFKPDGLGPSFLGQTRDACDPIGGRISFPTIRESLTSANKYDQGRIDIVASGMIYFTAAVNPQVRWTALSSIAYPISTPNQVVLQNNWVNDASSDGWRPTGQATGSVCGLTGSIKGGQSTPGTQVGSINKACLPPTPLVFGLQGDNKVVRMDLDSTGRLLLADGTDQLNIHLDAAVWVPMAGSAVTTPAKTGGTRSSVPSKSGYHPLSWIKVDTICFVYGVATGVVQDTAIGQLDTCRPKEHETFAVYDGANKKIMRVDVLPSGLILPYGSSDWVSFTGIHFVAA